MSEFEIISYKLSNQDIEKDSPDIMFIQIKGMLDFNTAPALQKFLDDCLSQRVYRFILDLGDTTYLGSTGIGLFINLRSTLEEHQGKVVFMRPSPSVKTSFRLFEFERFATITDNMKTALDELQVKREE